MNHGLHGLGDSGGWLDAGFESESNAVLEQRMTGQSMPTMAPENPTAARLALNRKACAATNS